MKTINNFILEHIERSKKKILERLNLNTDSKISINKFKDVVEKNRKLAEEAISLYNSNGNKKKITENLENFGFGLMNIINSIKIDEIEFEADDELCAGEEKRYYGELNKYKEPVRIIKRKNDDRITLPFGFYVKLRWKNLSDEDKIKFKINDIDFDIKRTIIIDVYKNGDIKVKFMNGWHSFFPQNKAGVQKKLTRAIEDIGIEWYGGKMISNDTLGDKPNIKDAIENLFELSDFTQNVGWNSSYRRQELLDKFIKILKIYDSKASFKDTDTRKDKDKYANIIGEINFNGKTHQFELLYRYNGYSYIDFEVIIDKEKVFYLSSHTTHWDAGCSSTDHNIIIDDKIKQILK